MANQINQSIKMANIINQISKAILLCCYLLPWENRGDIKCCLLEVLLGANYVRTSIFFCLYWELRYCDLKHEISGLKIQWYQFFDVCLCLTNDATKYIQRN